MGIMNILTGNFVGGMWWFLVGMFLQAAARMSYQKLLTTKTLQGEPVRRFMKSDIVTVKTSTTVRELVEDYIYAFHYKMFPVVEDGDRLAGCITTRDVKNVPKEEWSDKRVADLVGSCSPENTVGPDMDATEALSSMHRNRVSRLMVVEGHRLLGVITLKDMLNFLSLKMDLEGN
jgi:predicted transcriptional regulator